MKEISIKNNYCDKKNLPKFLITIDTEGDNLWSRPNDITTENSQYLPRFQTLCEKYHLKPTWLTNWEMVNCPVFCEFGKDVLQRETAEIGMHLHAWNSPSLVPLTKNDHQQQPYLVEYPESAMRDKVKTLTDQLQETFNCKMVSHRAGRWAFNQQYAEILFEQGYKIDCSVTPHIHWKRFNGQNLSAECDYRQHSTEVYQIESKQNPNQLALLELPMTVRITQKSFANRLIGNSIKQIPGKLPSRIAQRVSPDVEWFRPNGRNLKSMLRMLNQAVTEGWQYIMFMLHSSELMPGGSPRFSNQQKIERLYSHLEELFSAAFNQFQGLTLAEYSFVCQATKCFSPNCEKITFIN